MTECWQFFNWNWILSSCFNSGDKLNDNLNTCICYNSLYSIKVVEKALRKEHCASPGLYLELPCLCLFRNVQYGSDTQLIPYDEASLPTCGLLIQEPHMFSRERRMGCGGKLWAKKIYFIAWESCQVKEGPLMAGSGELSAAGLALYLPLSGCPPASEQSPTVNYLLNCSHFNFQTLLSVK